MSTKTALRQMHPFSSLLVGAALLVGGATRAETVQRFFDATGHSQGRAESEHGVTRYYDKLGRPEGRSETDRGGETRYFDSEGHSRGRAVPADE